MIEHKFKNYFPMPNEIYLLGLHPTALAIYGYLLYIENRRTFECNASYKTIAAALHVSPNTVRKYIAVLEEGGLITAEHTTVVHRDGTKWNGTMKYHIRPVREAIEKFYARQLEAAEAESSQRRAADNFERRKLMRPSEF